MQVLTTPVSCKAKPRHVLLLRLAGWHLLRTALATGLTARDDTGRQDAEVMEFSGVHLCPCFPPHSQAVSSLGFYVSVSSAG